MDLKYRSIKSIKIWIPLILFNVPILIIGYVTGGYPPVVIILSWVCVFMWAGCSIVLYHYFSIPAYTSDLQLLSLASLFLVVNPISNHPFLQGMMLYLMIFTAASIWYIYLDARIVSKAKFDLDSALNIPFMIPISCAIVTALLMG
jgi:hypothetical protein